MIKKMLLYCFLPFATDYMLFAFVNWDIAWVAHVDMIARWVFVLLFVAFFLMFSAVYLEGKDRENRG